MSQNQKQIAPYGTWESPLSADNVASQGTRLGQIRQEEGTAYWLESRPDEGGRGVIVRSAPDGEAEDITPEGYSVRSRVHEYAGADFWVHGGEVFFANDADQRIYRQSPDKPPVALTPEPETVMGLRYCDGDVSPCGSYMVCVRERHEADGEVHNDLIRIALQGAPDVSVVHSGFDFYADPRISPDGKKLVWISWDQPHMPWDATQLWQLDLSSGEPATCLFGGNKPQSIYQPSWSPSGILHFVSDRSGWWNLYSLDDGMLNALTPMAIDFGLPQWVFGTNTYTFADQDRILILGTSNGEQHLYLVETANGHLETLDLPWNHFSGHLFYHDHELIFGAASPTQGMAVIRFDLHNLTGTQLSNDNPDLLSPDEISTGRHFSFPTTNDDQAHAYYYPPLNADYCGPEDELPPLVVMSHGGPTSAADNSFSQATQFWTSRGFAVVDVNYRGSSGYGRAYRQRLQGQWGIYDVDDCVAAAQFLAGKNLVDGKRLAIRGGSAGGYTTLCALTFTDVFAVGCSRYGVADLELLASDSHKFEARYLDSLIGTLPEDQELYQARSPIHHTHLLSCPVLLVQGLEDKVVPPGQAEAMVAALEDKGLPHAYVTFANEQHGFRRKENIQRALEAELQFYAAIFGFELPEELPELKISGAD